MNVLDLFSGIGGFSLGLERAGMRTVAFCEIDPFCRRVLAKHWPGVPIFDDVRAVTGKAIGPVDIICGGFPCQDISSAGARVGIDGERSGLWSEYARIIGELRPRYVVVENVADLLVRGFGRVLGDLAALGYNAEWHCIPAAAVGADHWRDRIWIIAYPDSAGSKSLHLIRRQQRSQEVGKNAANGHSTRPPGWMQAGTIGADARAISARLGLALCSPVAFPELDRAGSPVLGRGEDGIPNRVDRMHALGNSVVPQIPEIIGRAILAATEAIEESQ